MKPIIDDRPLVIRYDSWTDDITIEGQHIRHVETRYEYDNPVSAVPSRQYTVVHTDTDLTEEQLTDLKQFIQTSGFETLAEAYGAPEEYRYYPYRLTIEFGELRKDVLYRSNPSSEKPPATFRAIERYLFELSEQVRRPVSEVLRVCYDSWTDDITVEDRHIRHEITEYEFADPRSGVPSSWRKVVVTDADLPEDEWTALTRFIRNSGVEGLEDAYGAPEGVRCYPYNLTVAWGDAVKEIRYRSNPAYGEPPEVFWEIERYLKELSERVRVLMPSRVAEARVP
jgi:hypothetical protein